MIESYLPNILHSKTHRFHELCRELADSWDHIKHWWKEWIWNLNYCWKPGLNAERVNNLVEISNPHKMLQGNSCEYQTIEKKDISCCGLNNAAPWSKRYHFLWRMDTHIRLLSKTEALQELMWFTTPLDALILCCFLIHIIQLKVIIIATVITLIIRINDPRRL